jgi:hypothetical protein
MKMKKERLLLKQLLKEIQMPSNLRFKRKASMLKVVIVKRADA